MFYQSGVAGVLFYAVVCWGGSTRRRDDPRLNKIIRRAGSVGVELDSVEAVVEQRTQSKLLTILDNASHPLHAAITQQRSTFSGRLLSQSCSADRHRKSHPPPSPQTVDSSGGRRGGGRKLQATN